MGMFDPSEFDLLALDAVIESYDYDNDLILQKHFHGIETDLCAQIENYGRGINDYGKVMMDHLRRTSEDGRDFLIHLGFSEKAANNFYHANLLQDLGKIHEAFDVELWSLPYRPSPEQKAEKREHVHRGPEIFSEAVQEEMDILFNHPHVGNLIPAIQMFHHERVDGKGTYGKTGDQMGKVIKAACIVDAKDGDMMKRPHQKRERTEEEALERMASDPKYDGAFDDLLDIYIKYRMG
ncbi:MAG: hypothetical protein AAF569_05760 [Pseudomonadota bacterium]